MTVVVARPSGRSDRQASGGRPVPLALTGLGLAIVPAALTIGAVAALAPLACLLLVLVAGVGVLVWRYPVVAALLTVSLTPLVAGIDRGRLIPVLRPNEALVAFLAGLLLMRVILTAPRATGCGCA